MNAGHARRLLSALAILASVLCSACDGAGDEPRLPTQPRPDGIASAATPETASRSVSGSSLATARATALAAREVLPTPKPRPSCVPRTEVLPTSTAYGPEDAANDVAFPCCGLDYLLETSTVVVSGTLGAVVHRKALRYESLPPPSVNGTPFPLPTEGLSYFLYQPITVREIFRAPDDVAVGDELLLRYRDPDSRTYGGFLSSSGESLDRGEIGATYLFFLEAHEHRPSGIAYEEPEPAGTSYTVVTGPYGRLIVNEDRVRYSDRDRHRTMFTLDRRGCEFLEELEEKLASDARGRARP